MTEVAGETISSKLSHLTANNDHIKITANEMTEPKRKVSIASNAIQADNERNRRISGVSLENQKRGILMNGGDNLNVPCAHYLQHNHYKMSCDCGKPLSVVSNCDLNERRISSISNLAETGCYNHYQQESQIERSWWYGLCIKCRQKEVGPGWEPNCWPKVCPHPFCPSYRHVARVFSLLIIGLLVWGVTYCIMGEDAAPGGQLFNIALLSICAHLGGWLFRMFTMPALVGMLLVGIIYENVGLINISKNYHEVESVLRKIALVVILTRAGLDLDPPALRRLWSTVIKLGLVPWVTEAISVVIATHYLLNLPWIWSFLLGSIFAAVAPAVVVPCLFKLRSKGYGVAKGIPTLVIAVSGMGDATSVAIFGIVHSFMFSQDSLLYNIVLGPTSLVVGLAFGIIWGTLAKICPEKGDPFAVPLRILMLLGGGLIVIFASEHVGLGGAGPLGVIAAAFVSSYSWSQQGWEIDDNPVATAFEIFWMIFEPILFGLTGTQFKFSELDPQIVSIAAIIVVSGVMIRILITVLVAVGSSLNLKEKLFVAFSWMAKASVQAALGPVALDSTRNSPNEIDRYYAKIILMVCVMSVLITAPTGAIIVTLGGSRLLTKGKSAIPQTGWRRTARPSIRDITIIDEEKEDDPESSEGTPEISRNEGRENRGVDVIDEEEDEKPQDPPTPMPKRNSVHTDGNNVS
uniref:Mitochondrial sodium/hydrogen exchanger 9B2 n=1 Tax=Cacopsylla melanoneura TaxID=428564 RepID=A0A8D8ZRS9_9HEMI